MDGCFPSDPASRNRSAECWLLLPRTVPRYSAIFGGRIPGLVHSDQGYGVGVPLCLIYIQLKVF
jgi:hypothetical protein